MEAISDPFLDRLEDYKDYLIYVAMAGPLAYLTHKAYRIYKHRNATIVNEQVRPLEDVDHDGEDVDVIAEEEDDSASSTESRGDLDYFLPSETDYVKYEFDACTPNDSIRKAQEFYDLMSRRQPVRQFSPAPVPEEVIRNIIKTAGTAPSVNQIQPWFFIAASSTDAKQKVRDIVEGSDRAQMQQETEEGSQVPDDSWKKEYLTSAPYLILIFKKIYHYTEDGNCKVNYYNEKSVAMAAGFLLTAIHMAGLVAMTNTTMSRGPSLQMLFNRPKNERFFLLIAVGYPSSDSTVPNLPRKPLNQILVEY